MGNRASRHERKSVADELANLGDATVEGSEPGLGISKTTRKTVIKNWPDPWLTHETFR